MHSIFFSCEIIVKTCWSSPLVLLCLVPFSIMSLTWDLQQNCVTLLPKYFSMTLLKYFVTEVHLLGRLEGGITHIFYCAERLTQIHKIDSHSFQVSHSSTKSLSLCWTIVLTCQSVCEKQYNCLWIMCLASLCWLNSCLVCREFCSSLFHLTSSPGCNKPGPISICSAR